MLAPALAFIILYPVLWASTAYAWHTTNVTCRPEYAWTTNSSGQNPRLVTAWLYVPCNGTGIARHVNSIPDGYVYLGPGKPMLCHCNTVVYSLLAACQNRGIGTWPSYSTNCTATSNGSYPESIADGTALPKWALLDVIKSHNFNVNAANVALQRLSDIVAGSSSASTSTSTSAPTSVPTSAPTLSISPSSAPVSPTVTSNETGTHSQVPTLVNSQTSLPAEQSTKNIGAIMGVAVGAVIGLLLVGALVLYIILHHRRKTRGDQNLGISQTAEVRELPGSQTASYHNPMLKGEAGIIRGVYDPMDPRTYPPTQRAGMRYTGLPQVMS